MDEFRRWAERHEWAAFFIVFIAVWAVILGIATLAVTLTGGP